MSSTETPSLEHALRPGTLQFARDNAERIDRLLAPSLTRLTTELRRLTGAEALVLRRKFADADTVWERFFWARVAVHQIRDGIPFEDAARYADEELLGLSVMLDPI